MGGHRLRATLLALAVSGAAGAVPLDPAAPNPGAASRASWSATAADAQGRTVAVGTVENAAGRSVIVAQRFVGSRPDTSWSRGSQIAIEAARGDATAFDVLALPDGKLLVAGALEDETGSFAALWRLHADGEPDLGFGEGGLLRASELPQSQVLSVHRDADGSLLVAVLVRGSEQALEVHAWGSADESPVRRWRQRVPSERISRPMLAHRSGRWSWIDAAQPDAAGVPLEAAPAASPWPSPGVQLSVAPAQAAAGHAVINPFADTLRVAREDAEGTESASGWPATLTALALLALGWLWRRAA